ncbi:MDR family MFS transporter [Paraliobacillus salinarum]|uniref:MDR family MFS transporter n=1 Tax=Paraliobacillus salinarum TaxID=1158996 RepID=UPI0015F6EEE9|nr:MDR family MFS transporter [Paraliobacillus salinarum]
MNKETSHMVETKAINKVPLLIVLISGAFVAILNQTLLATALPKIMVDLSLEPNTVQWLQSIFLLVNGIMIPITAFLIEKFTTRRLFLTAMGLFGLGTLVAAVAPGFSVLMVGRILQASGAGIMMPLMQTILFIIFPVEKRGAAMGMFGLVIAFAPAIGPTLSGWLIDQFPWRSLFYVILPIVIIDLVVAYFILQNVTERKFPKLDRLSIILSTFGFGGLLYGFSIAGTAGWASWSVIISLLVGAISLTTFIMRQSKLEQPILNFYVFKNKVFSITTALGMVVFIAMIGGAVILPLLTQDMLGYTATQSGLMLMPGAIIMGVMNPITGRLFDKYGARWLAIIGLSIVTLSTFAFSNLSTETTITYLTIMHAFRMFGISMVMMPVTTAGLNQLPPHLIPHGTAMNNTMRQIAGAMGTALLVSVMTNSAIPADGVAGAIHGVNVSFIVAGIISIVGLILSFFVKSKKQLNAENN